MFRIEDNNPRGFKENYCFDITRYYRIWFSKNPEVFLGVENELRFIRMREKNPTATITFIYSSKCLNQTALINLEKFCKRHQITPVDFDTELSACLTDEKDKQLYECARQEIQQTIQKKNGNLAAAADCVRLLISVIEKYGIYSDFDVEMSLSSLNVSTLQIRAPVLLNADMIQTKTVFINPNSDFLAFSFDLQNPEKLSNEALLAVRALQQKIIKNYTDPFKPETILTRNLKSTDLVKFPTLPNVFDAFTKTKPNESKHHTIFDFRKFVLSLKDPKLTDYLYHLSVINMSGPGIYMLIYKQLFPGKAIDAPTHIPIEKSWMPYISLYRKSSVGYYDPIADRVGHTNSILGKHEKKSDELSDLSWLEVGEKRKKAREEKMARSAQIFQKFWRKKQLKQFLVKHFENKPQYTEEEFKSIKEITRP